MTHLDVCGGDVAAVLHAPLVDLVGDAEGEDTAASIITSGEFGCPASSLPIFLAKCGARNLIGDPSEFKRNPKGDFPSHLVQLCPHPHHRCWLRDNFDKTKQGRCGGCAHKHCVIP